MTARTDEGRGGGSGARPYQDSLEHLTDELRRLDLLIRMHLGTMNMSAPHNQLSRTVCVTAEEVAWLLADTVTAAAAADTGAALRELGEELHRLSGEIDARIACSLTEGIELPLSALGRLFELSRQELAAVMVCLAPELRCAYDRLYAYLQDDITRQRPSVDLILQLLWPDERQRWAARRLFTEGAPLLRYGILSIVDDPNSPSGSTGLSRFLALDPRICQFLLGDDEPDPALTGYVRLDRPARSHVQPGGGGVPGRSEAGQPDLGTPHAEAVSSEGPLLLAERSLAEDGSGKRPVVFYLYGPAASGPPELARWTSHRLGMPLLDVDLHAWHGQIPDVEPIRRVLREGLLQGAAVHLAGADVLMRDDAGPLRTVLSCAVADFGRLVFLTGEVEWTGPPPFPGAVFQPFAVPLPDMHRSTDLWREALRGHTADAEAWAADLASRIRLSPERVAAAVDRAACRRLMEPRPRPLALADVSAACRDQARQRLGELATRVRPRARWEDLVLPEDGMGQLHEVCGQARHRARVFGSWGFGARLSRGTGLSVLFSGPPGTGKTMAAEVLARALDVELYTVDLSGVVSKYIGETEKNLSRIFSEASATDAILFFDEADALYGKRTEVSDARDRYANIETSYLLQRMEDYDGMVILATNLRQNMDEAFTRRLRFIVDFPFPETDSRLRIWRTVFPPQAPLAPDIDFARLAQEYRVTGGSIRNIALNAAFLAAADGGSIGWSHVMRSARREFEKIGKLWPGPEPQSAPAHPPESRLPASARAGEPATEAVRP